jgi:hypothetical protein
MTVSKLCGLLLRRFKIADNFWVRGRNLNLHIIYYFSILTLFFSVFYTTPATEHRKYSSLVLLSSNMERKEFNTFAVFF